MQGKKNQLKTVVKPNADGKMVTRHVIDEDALAAKNSGKLSSVSPPPPLAASSSAPDWSDMTGEQVKSYLQDPELLKDGPTLLDRASAAMRAGHRDSFTESDVNTIVVAARDAWLEKGGYGLYEQSKYLDDPDYARYNAAFAELNDAYLGRPEGTTVPKTGAEVRRERAEYQREQEEAWKEQRKQFMQRDAEAPDWTTMTGAEALAKVKSGFRNDELLKDPAALLIRAADAMRAGHREAFTYSDIAEIDNAARNAWLKKGGYSALKPNEYRNDPEYPRFSAATNYFGEVFSGRWEESGDSEIA